MGVYSVYGLGTDIASAKVDIGCNLAIARGV